MTMDVNTFRVAVTVAGLLLFLLLVLHTWSRRRQGDHEDAAMLPFLDDNHPGPAVSAGPVKTSKE
jgi:cytochrome c oxidase cbb3-type subunit 4